MPSRNASATTASLCACGCGERTAGYGARFKRGHHWKTWTRAQIAAVQAATLPGRGEAADSWQPNPGAPLTGPWRWPEKLMYECLRDAIDHYRNCAAKRASWHCPQCQRDARWFRATADYGPFSFPTICHALNLDEHAVRRWLFVSTDQRF